MCMHVIFTGQNYVQVTIFLLRSILLGRLSPSHDYPDYYELGLGDKGR